MSEMPEIPDDLKDHWYWRDQFLVLRTEPGKTGLSIYAGPFPPPVCFERARWFDEQALSRAPEMKQEKMF